MSHNLNRLKADTDIFVDLFLISNILINIREHLKFILRAFFYQTYMLKQVLAARITNVSHQPFLKFI